MVTSIINNQIRNGSSNGFVADSFMKYLHQVLFTFLRNRSLFAENVD